MTGDSNILDLFDPEFRTATVLAQAIAQRTGSSEINEQHLLLGMLAEPTCMAARLLAAVGADTATLASQLRDRLGPATAGFEHPPLGRDAAKAIRIAPRLASPTDGPVNTAHLLMALITPRMGWATTALKRAGVTRRASKAAYRSGRVHASPGLDPASVEWVWDYLPRSGRLVLAAEEAQASGNLTGAIDNYRDALAAAKEDGLDAVLGDIYPKLIQAHVLAGDRDAAIRWLDEADAYVENFEVPLVPNLPNTPEARNLIDGYEEAFAALGQDMRLQLLKDRARIHHARDQFAQLATTARRLIDTADELGHPTGMAAGRELLGLALAYQGGADDEAERNLLASLEPAELIEPVDVAARTFTRATLELLRGDPAEAHRLATSAETRYGLLGLQRSVLVTRLAGAEALVAMGEGVPPGLLDEVEVADPDGAAELLAWGLRLEAQSRRRAEPSAALAIIDRAVALTRQHDHRLLLVRCLLERGRIALALGQVADGRTAFEEAHRLGEELGVRFAAEAQQELDALGPDED